MKPSLNRRARALAVRPLVLAVGLALSQGAWPGTVTKVLTGDAAPGAGSGVSFATLVDLKFNNAGQVAYRAFLGGASINALNDHGVWRDGTLIARSGDAAPGAGGASFAGMSGGGFNAAGQLALFGGLAGAGVTSSNSSGIWRDNSLVTRQGDVAIDTAFFDSRFTSLGTPQIDGLGCVVYRGSFTSSSGLSSGVGIWRDDIRVVRTGDAIPGLAGGETLSSIDRVGPINTVGQSLFYGRLEGLAVTTGNNRGLWRDSTLVVRNGDAAAGLPGVEKLVLSADANFNAAINQFGQVAYLAGLRGVGIVSSVNDRSLWRDNTLIASTGQSAPGVGGGESFSSLFAPLINAAGQVAYGGTMTGGGVTAANNAGIWRDNTLIARTGDAIPGNGGAVRLAGLATGLQLNAAGVVAYKHGLAGTGVTSSNDRGLFLSDGIDTLQAARTGDAVAGSRVTLLFNDGVLNDKAQLAYQATLADGRNGIFVYTPALRWRSNGGGSWEDAANWTLGVKPADVHDVSLDPGSNLTVTGFAGTVTLKSLQIGTGAGQATLQMTGGGINAAEQVQIGTRGVLSGAGSLQAGGGFINTGTIAPGTVGEAGMLRLIGNLEHTGTLHIDLGRTSADLLLVSGTATLGGTLQLGVASGQRLARGTEHPVMAWTARADNSEFATLDFSQASGYRFTTAYDANGLRVMVTAIPFNWTGAANGGVWDVVNNWNDGTDGRPQAGDTLLLGSANTVIRSGQPMQAATVTGTGLLTINSGGSLDLSDSASLGGLNLSGSLNNAGRVVVVGGSTLSGAILSGAGTTRYEGALNISGNRSVLGSGHTLEVAGATTVRGNLTTGLSLNSGARIVNPGAWVEAASVNSSLSGNGGTSVFDNQGSFTKTTATTTTIGGFGLAFNNSGTVNVNAGTLSLVGGGASTGRIDIASGATLDFAGTGTYGLSRAVNNAGTFQVRGGTVNAPDGLALGGSTVISGGRLNLSGSSQFDSFNFAGGGTLNNNGTLVVTGPTNWAGSTLTGSGTTRLEGPLSLASSGITISAGTLVLAGTTTQTGTGGINTNGAGARIINEGNWVEQASGALIMGGAGATHFDNPGSFSKTSAFTTTIGLSGLAFNNTGTVKVDTGTLALVGGGNSPGQFKVATGATLQFGGGTMALGKAVNNAGTVRVSNGIVNAAQGLELGGSTVISGGTLNLGSSSQFDRFDFVGGGTLSNNGSLVVTGPTTWGGSVFSGTGITRLEGPLSLAGASSNTITSGTLVLAGTTTQTGAGNVNTSGGRLVNEGVWLEQASGNTSLGGGAASFENTGRFNKTSAFTTAIGSFGTAFKNTGTVDVQAGKLQVFSGFNNQGLLTIAAGAELHGTSSAFTNAGTLGGDGTVRAADRLTNTGTLAAGGLNDAGTLTLLGGLTQQASGIFLVDLGGTAAGGFDLLTVSANASLAGTLAVNVLDGAQFKVGDRFTVMTWSQNLNNSQFTSLDLTQAGGYGFATEYGANSLTVRVTTAVPEPGSWALMALGLAGLAAWTRRKAQQV